MTIDRVLITIDRVLITIDRVLTQQQEVVNVFNIAMSRISIT